MRIARFVTQKQLASTLLLMLLLLLLLLPPWSQIQNKSALYGRYEAGNKLDMAQFAAELDKMELGQPGTAIAERLFTRWVVLQSVCPFADAESLHDAAIFHCVSVGRCNGTVVVRCDG